MVLSKTNARARVHLSVEVSAMKLSHLPRGIVHLLVCTTLQVQEGLVWLLNFTLLVWSRAAAEAVAVRRGAEPLLQRQPRAACRGCNAILACVVVR